MLSKSLRIVGKVVVLPLALLPIISAQDWYDQVRSTGSSISPNYEAKDEQGTYKVLLNWKKGYMEFEAGATVDMSEMVNDAQAISVSKKTARYLAYQKAAEFLYGSIIEGQIGIGKGIAKMDILEGKVKGMVKNAVILKEDFEWIRNKRGGEDPWGTVKIGVLLWSNKPDQALLSTLVPEVVNQTLKAGVTNYSPPVGYPGTKEVYTGLIVNAKGLGVIPSLMPTISVKGDISNQVYGAMRISREYAIKNGIAGYEKDLEEARKNERISRSGVSNPIVVNAVGVSGVNNTNVEVSQEDGNLIVAADKVTGFLKECRVIFVVD